MQRVQIGGGSISPAVAAHIGKTDAQSKQAVVRPQQPATSMGGGTISPKVAVHVKTQVGGGAIHPGIAKHLR